jgi:hypothetical protein
VTPAEREALEARADELLAALHNRPVQMRPDDTVIVIDGYADPWVIPSESAQLALASVGGPGLAADMAGYSPPPGHATVVLVVGSWIQVVAVGLRPLSRGGEA